MTDKEGIRPLDPRNDLQAVADLIDICFAEHMDADGREFVRYLRQMANDRFAKFWLDGASRSDLSPLGGFVCVEGKRIIGNLSLIPFRRTGKLYYLIANVAVHPDHRRLGIGKRLTQEAVVEVRSRGADETWLHVRNDNLAAYRMYIELGFREKHLRTSWEADPHSLEQPMNNPAFHVARRKRSDWPDQKRWLEQTYPREIRWNLPLNEIELKPTILNEISHFFENDPIQQYSLYKADELLGVVSWQPSTRHADHLWLANPLKHDRIVIEYLFPQALSAIDTNKPVIVNLPHGRGEKWLPGIGFKKVNTLAWMKLVG